MGEGRARVVSFEEVESMLCRGDEVGVLQWYGGVLEQLYFLGSGRGRRGMFLHFEGCRPTDTTEVTLGTVTLSIFEDDVILRTPGGFCVVNVERPITRVIAEFRVG